MTKVLLAAALLSTAALGQQPDPSLLLSRALASQSAGDYAAAIRDYRALISLEPRSLEAHVNLGAALAQTGQYDGAIEQYRAAIAAMPAATPADVQWNIRMNLALAYYKKGDLVGARAELVRLHKAQPQDARIATLLGDTETRLGDAAGAVAMMAPMAPSNADNHDFTFVYGAALIRSGARRDGVALVERAAELGRSGDAYMLAGSTLLELNEYERARWNLEQALMLDPKLPGIYSLVGVARDRTGSTKEAEPALREAIKQNPDDFNANLYLGTILLKDRSVEEAKVFLERAVAIDPGSQLAHYEAALLKSTTGNPEGATAELEKVIASNPDWLEPHVELAALYYRLHKSEQGAKERAIVDRLTAAQQAGGPGK